MVFFLHNRKKVVSNNMATLRLIHRWYFQISNCSNKKLNNIIWFIVYFNLISFFFPFKIGIWQVWVCMYSKQMTKCNRNILLWNFLFEMKDYMGFLQLLINLWPQGGSTVIFPFNSSIVSSKTPTKDIVWILVSVTLERLQHRLQCDQLELH